MSFGNVGIFAYRLRRQAGVVEAARCRADAQRLGHGVVAGAPRRPPLFRQRQRGAVVADRARCGDRQDDLARPTARRRRTGRRRSSGSTPDAPRSSRTAPARFARTISTASCCGSWGRCRRIVIPTPFAKFGDLLYVSSGYVGDSTRPVYAIKPGGDGDISLKTGETRNASIAWSLPQGGTYNLSPIVYGDYFYTLFDRGFFTCHDAKTGKEIYTKVRLDPTASGFTASPWAYNGKIFAMSEDGTTYVIQAGPEFKVIGQNALDEFTMASPAIHQDSLIIRTATSLYRIGNP